MRWQWPLAAALAVMASAGAATPKFEVRLVVPCQPGEAAMVLVGSNEEFCLAKDKVFDAGAVVKVQRYPVLPKAVIHISEDATSRLNDLASEKEGERVGFVFNDRLIFAPFLYGPVKTKELQITLKNDPDDIDALVAAFPGDIAAQ